MKLGLKRQLNNSAISENYSLPLHAVTVTLLSLGHGAGYSEIVHKTHANVCGIINIAYIVQQPVGFTVTRMSVPTVLSHFFCVLVISFIYIYYVYL